MEDEAACVCVVCKERLGDTFPENGGDLKVCAAACMFSVPVACAKLHLAQALPCGHVFHDAW